MRQHQEKCAQQELIRDRVHVLTQPGVLVQPPRKHTIEAVADACQREEREGSLEPAVEYLDNQKRDKEETKQRQEVRSSSKLAK